MEKINICSFCGEETEPVVIDEGVGPTYKGDSFSIHKDEIVVSPCCEEPVYAVPKHRLREVRFILGSVGQLSNSEIKRMAVETLNK